MWILQNPWKAFSYITQLDTSKKFEFCAIINEDKYNSYKNKDELEKIKNNSLNITDVKIKNPNNPAVLMNAKMIRFSL